MPNRIKLLVNNSGYDSGIRYLIYRGDFSPVKDDAPLPLIEVDEQTVQKRMQTQNGQVLTQRVDAPSCFYAPHYFLQTPAPQVYIDGVPVATESIEFFPSQRMVRIHQLFELPTEHTVTMDYRYLQSIIEDDYTQPQRGVTHHGKDVPTGIHSPRELIYEQNVLAGTLKLTPVHDNTPERKYYRIRFQDTVRGRVSKPSADQMIAVSPNTFDLKWVLEQSKDKGKTWTHLQTIPFGTGEFVLTNPTDMSIEPHKPIPYTITPTTSGAVEIRLRNPWYMWERNTRDTNMYRIKTVDNEGQESKFKEYPVGGINFRPTILKIRRKRDNRTPAFWEGDDALTLHELTETTVDTSASELVFVDDHLIPGHRYSYTFHLEDDLGRRTPAYWEAIEMPTT